MNLLFHQAALGDFALILPTLRRLTGPTAVIAPWSHGRLAAALAPNSATMDIDLFEFTRLYAQGGPSIVSPAVQELFERARQIISFVADNDSTWATNVKRLAPVAKTICIPPRPPARWTRHVTDWHAEQLWQHGVELNKNPANPPPTTKANTNTDWLLHPGSGGVAKCWPLPNFIKLAQALTDQGQTVRFLIGDAEVDRGIADHLREQVDPATITHARDTETLLQTLHSATNYLGNDAGPTHVAAQCALRTVALFGPSDPRVWAPLGPNTTVVAPPQPAPMSWLSVEHVLDIVK